MLLFNCVLIKLRASQTSKLTFFFDHCRVCPNSWSYLQGSCYKFFSGRTSWNAAKSACEALGAKLVVLNSQAENQAVGEKITRGQGTYIGLYRNPRDKSRWLWVDQSRLTYNHWDSGEPNDVGGSEDCVHMRSNSRRYKWNDLPCNIAYAGYVCETRGKPVSIIIVQGKLNHSQGTLNMNDRSARPSLLYIVMCLAIC